VAGPRAVRDAARGLALVADPPNVARPGSRCPLSADSGHIAPPI
jgi:hypothetical protein